MGCFLFLRTKRFSFLLVLVIYFQGNSLAECEAMEYAIEHAIPDSLIVVLTENIKKVTGCR